MNHFKEKFIIVGAGFFGLTLAERISSVFDIEVAVIEKRDHIGGNAFSYKDAKTGIEIHKYGSHIFHTSSVEVWQYVNNFAEFNSYQHHVWTNLNDTIYSLPINLVTLQQFFGKMFSTTEAMDFFESFKQPGRAENLEQKAINTVGPELYKAFIQGYTTKQWGINPNLLPSETISRLPVRPTWNTRYFSDTYEGIPKEGYGKLFDKMVESKNIHLHLNSVYSKDLFNFDENQIVIYTGPIDEFFNYKCGELNWRTLDLEISYPEVADFQGTSVVNYASIDVPYTRIHEFKHFIPDKITDFPRTVIMKEFSRAARRGDDCYYPVNSSQDKAILKQYKQLQTLEKNVFFGGRLGSYQYLDMHMAIASALSLFHNKIVPMMSQ